MLAVWERLMPSHLESVSCPLQRFEKLCRCILSSMEAENDPKVSRFAFHEMRVQLGVWLFILPKPKETPGTVSVAKPQLQLFPGLFVAALRHFFASVASKRESSSELQDCSILPFDLSIP